MDSHSMIPCTELKSWGSKPPKNWKLSQAAPYHQQYTRCVINYVADVMMLKNVNQGFDSSDSLFNIDILSTRLVNNPRIRLVIVCRFVDLLRHHLGHLNRALFGLKESCRWLWWLLTFPMVPRVMP